MQLYNIPILSSIFMASVEPETQILKRWGNRWVGGKEKTCRSMTHYHTLSIYASSSEIANVSNHLIHFQEWHATPWIMAF